MSEARDVAVALDELRAIESLPDRAVMLGGWASDFPRATSQLLRVIARDPVTSLELASTVLAAGVDRGVVGDNIDEVLIAAFPKLTGPLREAAADREGVRTHVALEDDLESLPPPDPSWLWPVGRLFPAPETVEGVQARLNFRNLGAGPVNGTWNELTRRAFVRWQVLNGFEPTGELDARAIDTLRFTIPDAPD
ncbi:MAG TPA: peptidoglycan-binding domain-containing protein [Kofleriaceae bacterium]